MSQLVLSTFPGLDLLGMGFERAGFCVVQGPDLLWGRNVHEFHPPSGRFDGVVGGPPCPTWSRLSHLIRAQGREPAPDLIPEFRRVILEAQPAWFLMENVPAAPVPEVEGYTAYPFLIDNRWIPDESGIGQEQQRVRLLVFGTSAGHTSPWPQLELAVFESPIWSRCVMASGEMVPSPRVNGTTKRGPSSATVAEGLRLQGLPSKKFEGSPYTVHSQQRLVGNAVPLPMAETVARAIKRVVGGEP